MMIVQLIMECLSQVEQWVKHPHGRHQSNCKSSNVTNWAIISKMNTRGFLEVTLTSTMASCIHLKSCLEKQLLYIYLWQSDSAKHEAGETRFQRGVKSNIWKYGRHKQLGEFGSTSVQSEYWVCEQVRNSNNSDFDFDYTGLELFVNVDIMVFW